MARPTDSSPRASGSHRLRFSWRRQTQPVGKSVQVWVRSRRRRRPWLLRGVLWLLAAVAISGGGTLLVLSLLVGSQLILNPTALPWLEATFFAPAPTVPITLEDLKTDLATRSQQAGSPLKLQRTVGGQFTEYWIIPVQTQAESPQIVNLRAYRVLSGGVEPVPLQLLSQVAIPPVNPQTAGMDNAPRVPSLSGVDSLPLQQLERLPSPEGGWGFWLALTGHDANMPMPDYGQVAHFDPEANRLTLLAAWFSPHDTLPRWTDLDGETPLDLIVEQKQGLEPAFQGWRVTTDLANNLAMNAVSLRGVPLEVTTGGADYRRSLVLATSGLWSEALKQLQQIKVRAESQWSPLSEAQLRLIEHHAQATQTLAERTWANPSQEILTQLIAGRWQAGLSRWEQHPEAHDSLMRSLAADDGRLWDRVLGTLRVHRHDAAALFWGSLILHAQEDAETARDWLARRKAPVEIVQQFERAIAPPPEPVIQTAANRSTSATYPQPRRQTATQPPQTVSDTAASPAQPAITPAITGIIGQVTPIAGLNLANWTLWSDTVPDSTPEQWYEIQPIAWQQDQVSWSSSSPSIPPDMGKTVPETFTSLAAQPLQMLVWVDASQGYPVSLTLQGLRVSQGRLVFLARGETMQTDPTVPPPLVFSANSLAWLDDSAAQSPANVLPLVNAFQRHLLETQPYLTISTDAVLSTLAPAARYYSLDFTGDGTPEHLLSLGAEALDQLQNLGVACNQNGPKTLIVDKQGNLLYTDLFRTSRRAALLVPGQSPRSGLVVYSEGSYRLESVGEE